MNDVKNERTPLETMIDAIDMAMKKYRTDTGEIPPLGEIVEYLETEYSTEEILKRFDNYEIIDYLEDSFEMDRHDDNIREKCEEDFNEKFGQIEKFEDMKKGEWLENCTPDELWNVVSDFGSCSPTDRLRMTEAFKKLTGKLKSSGYNRQYKI